MVEKKPALCSNLHVESDVFIALGSNEGDRELALLGGVAELGRLPGTRVTGLSPFYDTEPVGPVPQGNFLNAAARIETTLAPRALLSELQRIETGIFHRKRELPWGPRAMDLDILFYGELIMSDDALVIPHPRLHERRFVLRPLSGIAPEFIHPVLKQSVAELLAALKSTERVTLV